MKTIDIAELEHVTGGIKPWMRTAGRWIGRALNYGGAGLTVAEWFGGGEKPAQPPSQPQPPASH